MMAARPRTLVISTAPVLAATAHAYAAGGGVAVAPVLAALVASIAIQIATNLFNDAADGARGHDGPARLGPPRVTALGLIPAREVARAGFLCAAVACCAGLVAVAYGGWPILAVGVASLCAGWAYSNGPAPISASPLGEFFVVAFFGVAAVAGVAYLAAPASLSAATLALGVALGAPAAATLTVNNHRDRAEDARNGRRTLALLLGERGATALYAGLMSTACALFAGLAWRQSGAVGLLVSLAAVAPALALARRFARTPVGSGLNALIARTAAFELWLAALYVGLVAWAQLR
jgi:1,4-dihydroxy-2-naphthoate octaprenyltransferase